MRTWILSLLICFACWGCDILRPQKQFTIVLPEKDYYYHLVSDHLQKNFENHGYKLQLIHTKNATEACKMVTQGEADLTLVNSHSDFIAGAIGEKVGRLRTILPLTERLLFVFRKTKSDSTGRQLFDKKRIGIEVLEGEAHQNLKRLFDAAKISPASYVTDEQQADVYIFWGTFYGMRAQKFLQAGWYPTSLPENWIDFMTLSNPAFSQFTLPAQIGIENSLPLHTIATHTILLGGKHLSDNSVYELAKFIFDNKQELMVKDIMYRYIDPSFDQSTVLFPVHEGTLSYLQRDQPTILERYADAIALIITIIAIIYGGVQTIQLRIRMREKDKVDEYFMKFLLIRSDRDNSIQVKKNALNELMNQSIKNLTNERLEKTDFHMLATIIQQEIAIIESSQIMEGVNKSST